MDKKEVKNIQGFNKETLLGMFKSKTVRVNTILTAAIVAFANAYGVPLTPDQVATLLPVLYGGVNIILRFFTDKSLPEKGIVIENPVKVRRFVEAISENEEAIEELYTAIAKWKNDKVQEGKFTRAMKEVK